MANIKIYFAAVLLLSACGNNKDKQNETALNQPVNFKMASTYPSSLTLLGTMAKRFEKQIDIFSAGNVKFRFFEPRDI
jgi:TRAP-type mannitol/chloroaromatic compound transport system substrate-binding protein